MGHRVALSVLSLMMLLAVPFAGANARVNTLISSGALPYPPVSANVLSAVFRGEYTSPQFDYTVTWGSSWGPDSEAPFIQEDGIWLKTDKGFATYLGIESTDQDMVFDWWAALNGFDYEAGTDYDGGTIAEDHTNRESGRVIILSGYDMYGVYTSQYVTTVPLQPGFSMLLISHEYPVNMPLVERQSLEDEITVILPNALGGGVISGLGNLDRPANSSDTAETSTTVEQADPVIQTPPNSNPEIVEVLPQEEQYTIRITCRNVTQSYGAWYGDCDSPFSITNYECIEDRSPIVAHGVMKLLCKLK